MIYLNGTKLNITLFPDNTSQVWRLSKEQLAPSDHKQVIDWHFTSENEVIHLAQLMMLLNYEGDFYYILNIKYLPYGRQDKMIGNNNTFGLRTFARILNDLDFDEVTIVDPHSNAALDLIKNSIAIYPTNNVTDVFNYTKSDIICYPDKGALNKYVNIYSHYNHVYAEKVRDQLTGNISSCVLVGNVDNKNILIVDDICDGGATFKLVAEQLINNKAKEVNLFVTHGLFSKGLQTLKDSGIKKIFTQDGEAVEDHNNNIFYRTL